MAKDNGNFWLALLTGAAIGAGIGILYAPNKGSKTRKKIKKKAAIVENEISEKVLKSKEDLTNSAKEKKDRFEKGLDSIITNAKQKSDEIIKSLEHRLEELKKKNVSTQK